MSNFFIPHELESSLSDSSREAEFLRQLAATYRDLYASALSIVGNRDDADDAIQEVCVVLWQKYDEFEPGTNFRKWACAVAFNVAKAYARKQRRRRGYGLSDQSLAKIAQLRTAGSELFELRREVLRDCVGKLAERDREFLGEHYHGSSSLAEQARVQGSSVEALYARLKRIRRLLTECIHRSLGKGE
ncbi:sigma-70 family RNA polymerase sigma factor [Planctomicrobium piriforme]|uniref:RNA polymerase sigma-70 factor, ECF subfamily n=1 Tax=Planctomicrobium piriforme TaxID=1576369 RepID=A0A1I3LQ49_9PLAN|nr:sigma-70 family RNA polymerase sigma factor [Planctomicrobium piriforme]SFI86899.1 RNA polymerase sigma-70 factor, ECF subfamily [Planctomicrobium piriforme]